MKTLFVIAIALLSLLATAQDSSSKPRESGGKQSQEAATTKAPVLSPSARLAAAKTVLVKKVEGGDLAVDTIVSVLEGWGHYTVLNGTRNASSKTPDLIIDVTSPAEESGGVSVSSSTTQSSLTGRPEQSTSTRREFSTGSGPIRIVVRDGTTGSALWSATEVAKGALKKNARENNVVEAAQRLVSKFRQRVDPR